MMDAQTFQIISTDTIPLYYPTHLGSRTIVIQVSATWRRPSRNARFVKLISFSHCSVSGSFHYVAYLIHPFRCSSLIPNVLTTCHMFSPYTTTDIYSTSGGSYGIYYGCTIIGIAVSSGGAACRGPNSVFRCVQSPIWWEDASSP